MNYFCAFIMKICFLSVLLRLKRKIDEMGLPTGLGILMIVALFIGLTELAYYRSNYAHYIIPFLPLAFQNGLKDLSRKEWITINFGTVNRLKIYLIEHLTIALPFSISLLVHHFFLTALLTLCLSLIHSFYFPKKRLTVVFKTPFKNTHFEGIEGFRTYLLLYIFVSGCLFFSLTISNFNLSLVVFVAQFLIILLYNNKKEPEFHVWNFAKTPSQFLFMKLKNTLISCFIFLPSLFIFIYFYAEKTWIILLLLLVILTGLLVVQLAKYARYPTEIGITDSVLFALCFSFPPLLLILGVYYFYLAKKNLHGFLSPKISEKHTPINATINLF